MDPLAVALDAVGASEVAPDVALLVEVFVVPGGPAGGPAGWPPGAVVPEIEPLDAVAAVKLELSPGEVSPKLAADERVMADCWLVGPAAPMLYIAAA